MKSGWSGGRWLVFGAVGAGILAATQGSARADGPGSASASVDTGGEGDKTLDAADLDQLDETAQNDKDGTFFAWADFVLGFGKEPIAVQIPPTSGPGAAGVPTYTTGSAQTYSESTLLGLSFAATHNLRFGFKIPLVWSEFNPPASDQIPGRAAGTVGNLELEAEHVQSLSDTVTYFGILGVSLPTATGTDLPSAATLKNEEGFQVDQGAYDAGAALRAAALSRGQEVDALFATHRLGINPKLQFAVKIADGLTLTPSIKMENLIRVTTDTEVPHAYLGELVPALALTYDAGPHFQPLLKVWANWAFSGSEESKNFGMAVEPQALLTFGGFHTGAGVIVPFVGPATDPQFIGVRLFAGMSF